MNSNMLKDVADIKIQTVITATVTNEDVLRHCEAMVLQKLGINRKSAAIHNGQIGYWYCDDGGGYFEHEPEVWKCLCDDPAKVEIFKHMLAVCAFLYTEKE